MAFKAESTSLKDVRKLSRKYYPIDYMRERERERERETWGQCIYKMKSQIFCNCSKSNL